ncbi:hypothetical protein [Terrimonas pollutisoli]|uniref:hypothetical protein n=1 Tax=Terrimonas pollutisoli TaxID=3034147 RepID=UPI0023ED7560|nr:hypothetical protein [Terrimonas sp. H1YJ31]
MNSPISKTSFSIIFTTLIVLSNTSYGQKDFTKLLNSIDSSYGFTAQNPLKLKKGNQEKSITNAYIFLSGLKTQDNQKLALLSRMTTEDPNYKEPAIKINNRYTGMPISGKLGLLDKYVFLTQSTRDTVTIYVDIYNKGTLMLPIGLKYEQPQK